MNHTIQNNLHWHYIEYNTEVIRTCTDIVWIMWLHKNVGQNRVDWKWDDSAGHLFICFKRTEDATAFRLKFNICA